MNTRKHKFARSRKRGTATVELAVCLPLLALIVAGSIQACEMLYLRHGVVTAAYEGSLEVARPDASMASVQARVAQVLEVRGVEHGGVSITSAGAIEDLFPGDPVTVVVTAPVQANLTISKFISMPHEVSIELHCCR